jgi:DNA-binding transcriptional ArsR family regulator
MISENTIMSPGDSKPDQFDDGQAGGEQAGSAAVSPEVTRIMNSARTASDYLKAVAHENRLLILCLLAEGERSVTEMEEILSLRQTAVSQQLARLRLDNLVTSRRDGKSVYYSLANPQTKLLLDALYTMYCRKT